VFIVAAQIRKKEGRILPRELEDNEWTIHCLAVQGWGRKEVAWTERSEKKKEEEGSKHKNAQRKKQN